MRKKSIQKKRIKRSRIKRSKSKLRSKNKRQKRTLRKKYKGGDRFIKRALDRIFLTKEDRDLNRESRRSERKERVRIKREERERRERIESGKKTDIDVWFKNTKASSIPGKSLKCIPSYFTKEEVNEYLATLKGEGRDHGVIELVQDSYKVKMFEYNTPTRYLIRSYWPYSESVLRRYKSAGSGYWHWRWQLSFERDQNIISISNRYLRWSELKKLDRGIQNWLESWEKYKKDNAINEGRLKVRLPRAPIFFCNSLEDSDNCYGRIVNINVYFNQDFFINHKWREVIWTMLPSADDSYITIEHSIIHSMGEPL